MQDQLITNAAMASMTGSQDAPDVTANACIAVRSGRIAWCGLGVNLPAEHSGLPQNDVEGRLVTPGLIDCHTHLVFGGNRAREFEMRLEGASYEQIALAGGGILSTVTATRSTSEPELLAGALARADALIAEGVTTLEIKSGYGLDVDTELAMLRVARAIAKHRPVTVRTSFLGAHAVPPQFKGRARQYLTEVCIPALEAAAASGLVDAVDAFCETIAFSIDDARLVFERARTLGLPVKLHADQLSNLGGARLAASFGAMSADHLEYVDEAGVMAMAVAKTVAVILPGAFYTLRETTPPPIALFRKHGVAMAVSTDSNPGSSPITSLLTTMNMACTLFRMTPHEVLAGVTRNAALALGLKDAGCIAAGYRADLAVWNAGEPAELCWRIGFNPLYQRIFGDRKSVV